MNTSYKFELFDADVGGNVHQEVFNDVLDASKAAESVLYSYELDPGYADSREIAENDRWDCEEVVNSVDDVLFSRFFDSVSVWLPGHHRKITLTKIEEKIEENN